MAKRARCVQHVVSDRKKKTLQAKVKAHVEAGSALYSDALKPYEGLELEYAMPIKLSIMPSNTFAPVPVSGRTGVPLQQPCNQATFDER